EIQTGKWMWWQFEEDGKEVNNMGLPIAIFYYESGHSEVAVLRGVEVAEEEPSQSRRQTRVVCSPECWIIEVENIGSAVTEEEIKEGGKGYGRVATTNSNGERFSLDRYHLLMPNKPQCTPIYSITLETTQMIEGRISCAEYRLELAPKAPAPPSLFSEPGQSRGVAVQERRTDTPEPDSERSGKPDAQLDTGPDAAEQDAEPNAAEQGSGPDADPDDKPNAARQGGGWDAELEYVANIEPDTEPDTEPGTEPETKTRDESDFSGLDAGPDAESNVAPDVEQNIESVAEPEAERDIEPGSESDAPLTAAEQRKTQVQEMSNVSASTLEAQGDDDDHDGPEYGSDQPPRRQSKRLRRSIIEAVKQIPKLSLTLRKLNV
ncbi:hypothetical protein KC323_g9318, partial [Hortaea werneckii]